MSSPQQHKYKHPHPAVSVDVVMFSVKEDALHILLIRRAVEPFKDQWALPGGFLQIEEDLDSAAARELREETGVDGFFLEQIGAFGAPGRDPRERVITVGYWAIIPSERIELMAGTDASDARWFDFAAVPETAFDHIDIIDSANMSLRDRLRTTSVALQFLPEEFTLTQLQRVHEVVLGEPIDKRNFRKWARASELIARTGQKQAGAKHRPAELYTAARVGEVIPAPGAKFIARPSGDGGDAAKSYRKGYKDGIQSVMSASRKLLKSHM